ncbi:transposase [Okeania sp. SIO2C2]|uniref:transposase n=1 Tax=Okeania sp. SIO2C2 TaxID=2607787 RepID=UPI00257B4FB7|nr:transposase [Okeania sp. SIO2C2]
MNAIGSGLTHLKWCIRIASQKLLLPRQAIALQQAVKRETWLCGEVGRKALREAIERVREKHPFSIDAFVLLPEHFHCLWTLPPNDGDFSKRLRLIKTYVTKHYGHRIRY